MRRIWIFNSYYKGCVELWSRDGRVTRRAEEYPQSFYLYLKDPHAHWEMVEALASRFKVEEISFRTIYGIREGYKIYADRKVAERIEVQTSMAAELYNVDMRLDQRYMAERDLFPCGWQDESRFAPGFEIPLSILELKVIGDAAFDRDITRVEVCTKRPRRLEGPEGKVLSDLLGLIKVHDPDVILLPNADTWVPLIIHKAKRYGLEPTISRTGWFKQLGSKSYWSYGWEMHREGTLIPEGRILIDTERSFTYREGGLKGVLMAARLSGLPPNMTSRFTPGTLISSYEVFEAVRRGIAMPFRKRDAESFRNIQDLREADRGT
jgi:DNA polymerase, archaea type